MVRHVPKLVTNNCLYETETNLSSEPAREARRRPGCCFELRRAKRAGAQTGIRVLGNKKALAPESGARGFKKVHLALGSLGKFSYQKPGVYGRLLVN